MTLTKTSRWLAPALVLLLALAQSASAQQAVWTDAAVQPSRNVGLVRQQAILLSYDGDDAGVFNDTTEFRSRTSFSYGLTKEFAFTASVPLVYRDTNSDLPDFDGDEFGLDDVMIMTKLRLWQNDFGPTDTARFSVMAGASVPVGDSTFSSGSVDPMVGAVYTIIDGRHGFNASARYRINTNAEDIYVSPGTGEHDALFLDSAYLFRFAPTEYTPATSSGAWYAVIEGVYTYETDNSHEFCLAPGIMFEGSRWAFEASVMLPVYQDVQTRPERNFGVTVGLRYLF